MLQVEVRTQDADPVALFTALRKTLNNLHESGWTARDIYRTRQHLRHQEATASTSPRLESVLLTEVFGDRPSLDETLSSELILEDLRTGIALDHPVWVLEVADATALAEHAEALGLDHRILRAAEIEIEPTE